MSFLARFVIDTYSKMLNLYPHRFKDEFAVEMHAVFKHSIVDAAEEGPLALILVCGREFIGMPFNIVGVYRIGWDVSRWIWLAILTWGQNKALSIALILVPLALPLIAGFPTYFGYYIVPAGLSFEFAKLIETYNYLIFFIGALWLLMSGWT